MKYKIGDKVRIKSVDWYNEHKDMNGNVYFGCQDIFNPCTARHCGQVLTIKHINCLGWYEVEEEAVFVKDGMIEGLVEDEISFDTEYELKHEFNCPDGYQFVDENGNVINTTKIILEKKKKEYPKTFRECCEIIGLCSDTLKWSNPFCINRDTHPYIKHLDNLMERFCKLFICRNAYWKIAGEQMGLGKPWEPDWTNEEWPDMAYINYDGKNIDKDNGFPCCNMILIFPTEEMRDAFYENFKGLIEQCKELL